MSKRSGQRFESLEVLKRATDLARSLDLPAEKFHELRNEIMRRAGSARAADSVVQ